MIEPFHLIGIRFTYHNGICSLFKNFGPEGISLDAQGINDLFIRLVNHLNNGIGDPLHSNYRQIAHCFFSIIVQLID